LSRTIQILIGIAISLALTFYGCTCREKASIRIDGSSTVFVISEAIAEEYKKTAKENVSVGISGTGGGFKKLCSDRIDIIGASRKITQSEIALCKQNNINYMELPVAYDGIVVVVNKENRWLSEMKVSTLKLIFEPAAEGKILSWSDIDPSWPDRKFEIFAPGISSGTYDYFTKAIIGKEHSSRGDMTTSENDNVLVHGVRSTIDSIGFFSFAYYLENQDSLKALPIIDDRTNNIKPGVMPTAETIRNGEYAPLSRAIYLYANKNIDDKTRKFLRFYVENSQKIASFVGFIRLHDDAFKEAMTTLSRK
jgi:phosphate transport system substrate-binding protein